MTYRPVLGCIADDFTGATDLANNLVRAGMRTVQTIGIPADAKSPVEADAIVVALKSRTIAPADAVAQSLTALQWLKSQGVEQIYFKYCSTFDSTPQGNIGPVTDALLDALHGQDQGFTIVCPAFPENHRTVFKGHLFVGDVLLSDSGMRQHPLTPMTDANLVRVMQAQSRRKVGLVAHDVVARGADAMTHRFAELRAEGIGIVVVDAVSNADLLEMGKALSGMPLVTAGSGVAIGLPQNWKKTDTSINNLGHRADALPAATGLCAVVSGSCSQATNAQVLHFRQQRHPVFAIDPLAIAAGDNVVVQALTWASQLLPNGPVLIYATAESDSVKAVQAKLGVERAGALVEQTLSQIAVGLVNLGVRQLLVAGGETSGAVVQALGIERMAIGPQIDPGVPWTAVSTAQWPGTTLHVALKSGNFGSVDFFTKAFTMLEAYA
jgi:3-dehydrotetronate 4-kinase